MAKRKPKRSSVNPKELKISRLRHQSLPPDLLKELKDIWNIVGPYQDGTLEQFEIGFMRDMHPEREVAIWLRIAMAWIYFNDDKLPEPSERADKQMAALVAMTTGVRDRSALKMSAKEFEKLLASWTKACEGSE